MERSPRKSKIVAGLAVAAAALGVMETVPDSPGATERFNLQHEEVTEAQPVSKYPPEYVAMKISQLIEQNN